MWPGIAAGLVHQAWTDGIGKVQCFCWGGTPVWGVSPRELSGYRQISDGRLGLCVARWSAPREGLQDTIMQF